MEYECRKCKGKKIFAKPNGRRMGIYCADCGEWIAWTTYQKAIDIYAKREEENLEDGLSLRKIKKYDGVTTMRCSKCNCLLYISSETKTRSKITAIHSYDLVNANYCPNCGRRLI